MKRIPPFNWSYRSQICCSHFIHDSRISPDWKVKSRPKNFRVFSTNLLSVFDFDSKISSLFLVGISETLVIYFWNSLMDLCVTFILSPIYSGCKSLLILRIFPIRYFSILFAFRKFQNSSDPKCTLNHQIVSDWILFFIWFSNIFFIYRSPRE